jgi:hypothetical protein
MTISTLLDIALDITLTFPGKSFMTCSETTFAFFVGSLHE